MCFLDTLQALSAPQKLVIDLDFSGLMTAGELKSLCQQLSYSYSIAVNGEPQMHLHLLGAAGDIEAALHKQLPGHVHWSATKSEKGFQEFFQVGRVGRASSSEGVLTLSRWQAQHRPSTT
jgi:hypothetical protein